MNTDSQPRVYLVVADESPEMAIALRYAAWRAHHIGGHVVLLHVIEPHDINHWGALDAAIMAESTAHAQTMLQPFEAYVRNITGSPPIVYIKRGDTRHELIALLQDHPEISVLVLGAHTGAKGPGPLVSYLTSVKGIKKLKIPLIIVPDTYGLEKDNLLV